MCSQKQPPSQEFMGSQCFIRLCSRETRGGTGGEPRKAGAPPGWPQLAPRHKGVGRGRCPCELTPASPFIQGCSGREVPRLRELWPSVRGLSSSLPSLVCGPPSSLPLWLCTGHLGSRGHFACIWCLLHRTLGNVNTALFLFNFICQLFFVI